MMNLPRHILSVALLAVIATPAARAEVPIGKLAGSDVSFEGMIQSDANWFDNDVADLDADPLDGSDSEFGLRRVELILKGKGPGKLDWVIAYDAKADKWLDTNLKYKLGSKGSHYLQLGQYKQPIGLEELSSSKNNDFISKAAVTNTWAVGRRLGVAYGYVSDSWSITGAGFTRELTRGNAAGDGFAVRGSWAPINRKGHILHLGLSHANYDAELAGADAQRWRARPQADLAGVRLVDTGRLANANRVRTTGIEGLWVQGPVKLQAEYMRSTTTRDAGFADFNGSGAYVSALWNVTGESWGYKAGVPSTSKPANPAKGMLQLGLRYDTLDLDDGAITSGATPVVSGVLGGKMNAWTLGANYYWQSNFKFALNYVKVDTHKYNAGAATVIEDNPSILEFRAQLFW